MASHQQRTPVLLYEEHAHVAPAMSALLRTQGFAVAVTDRFDAIPSTLHTQPDTVVVLSCSIGGIAQVTSTAMSLRQRPEPHIARAGIIALVDSPADADFGLRTEVDRVLIRPMPIDRFATAIHDVATAQPEIRARVRLVA